MTTAVITANDADAPRDIVAEEIDAAYDERDEWNAIEADLAAFASALEIMGINPEELILGIATHAPRTIRPHRRANPCAHSMTRRGRRYVVRKDHGTTAFYKQISAFNAKIEEGKKRKRPRRRQSIQDFRARREVLATQRDAGDIDACPTCHGEFYVVAESEDQCTHGYCFERDYRASDGMFDDDYYGDDWLF